VPSTRRAAALTFGHFPQSRVERLHDDMLVAEDAVDGKPVEVIPFAHDGRR